MWIFNFFKTKNVNISQVIYYVFHWLWTLIDLTENLPQVWWWKAHGFCAKGFPVKTKPLMTGSREGPEFQTAEVRPLLMSWIRRMQRFWRSLRSASWKGWKWPVVGFSPWELDWNGIESQQQSGLIRKQGVYLLIHPKKWITVYACDSPQKMVDQTHNRMVYPSYVLGSIRQLPSFSGGGNAVSSLCHWERYRNAAGNLPPRDVELCQVLRVGLGQGMWFVANATNHPVN